MPGKPWIPKYIAELLDGVNLSTDGTFAANSDLLLPTQKAVKTYVAGQGFLTSLGIGSSTQAYSANLTTFAGIAPSANAQTLLGHTFAQMLSDLGAQPAGSYLTSNGLPNVTNDTQTKAAIVPNTAPAAAQLLIGNAGGTAYAPVTLSGPVSINSAGVTTVATLNQNTSGTAANLSGTPALPNGVTATTQAASDNSTKLATTAYCDTNFALAVLLAGRSGGQTIKGDTASGGNLTWSSTAHATKGKILFGNSAYDEVNNRLGIGTTSPSGILDVKGGTIYLNSNGLSSTNEVRLPGNNYFGINGFLWLTGSGNGMSNGKIAFGYNNSSEMDFTSDSRLVWNSTTSGTFTSIDTGLSRGGAGKLYLGNGTQGDYTGTLIAGNVGIGTTSPSAQLTLVKADSSGLTDFLINPTAKTSGNLIDAQVGGVSKFSVDNAGVTAIGNTVAAAVAVASTHKVTIVIGGTTYYLLASNV